MSTNKTCTNCPGAIDHDTAHCPLFLLRERFRLNEELPPKWYALVLQELDAFVASQQEEQPECGCCDPDCDTLQHPEQAGGAQGEREAFEAHESRERRLSPADQKFWFRRGAVADYDIKSIDDAWKAWKARAALAQPALQCKKCGGTGDADSGGIHPWGEAAMVPCDCAHTERARGKRTEDGDTIIDRLRLGGLTIDGDNAYKRDLLDCVVGALAFGFQGRPAPEETHWLHRFWEIGNAEREARAALAQPFTAFAKPSLLKDCDVRYAANAQPSPAPELELERPEVVAFMMEPDMYEPYVSLRRDSSCQGVIEPLMTVAQHERILRKAPVAQAWQLHELDKQCRDDVARALGLTPQGDGYAWSALLADIKTAAKVAQAGQAPEVSGIARAYDHPSAVILYLRKEPTDDDLRAIQEGLRVLAAAPAQGGE